MTQPYLGGPPPWRPRAPSWLWVLTLVTGGYLGFVPPLVIATRLRTPQAWWWAVGFGATEIVGLTLSSWLDGGLGYLVILLAGIASIVYSTQVGKEVEWSPPPPPFPPPALDGNARAVAGVLAARQRRADAANLAARDPELARELRIGRPDLPRTYDDGGLVDVNGAPGPTIATWLGLTEEQAGGIVAARAQVGRFERPEDLLNLADLDVVTFEHLRDRIITL